MSTAASQQAHVIRRLARRIADIVAECNDASRRMMALVTAPDRYAVDPGGAPDTYADFLYRTSGVLPHEASARKRLTAQSRR